MNYMKKPVQVNFEKEQWQKIKAKAKEHAISVSKLARMAVDQFLKAKDNHFA